MAKKNTVLLLIMILGGFTNILQGQIFPGDADNNGEVDNYDILYIGYAYGTVGPARVNPSSVFEEQPFSVAWEESFSDGTNYAFADANGSGLVEWGDLSTVFSNYGNQHSDPTPPVLPLAIPGIDPQLDIGPVTPQYYTAGSQIQIPVVLGTPQLPISSFNGIAFSATYDETYIEDAYFEVSAPWLGPQGIFYFQSDDPNNEGVLDVALTHYGNSPGSSGFGPMGTLNFIVEDVLVDLLVGYDSTDITVGLNGIMLLDTSFNLVPVLNDSITVRIYNPNAVVSAKELKAEEQVRVFPNPSQGAAWVRAGRPIEHIRLYNLFGQPLGHWQGYGQRQVRLPLQELGISAGTYLIEVEAHGKVWKKKLLFLPEGR